MLVSFYFPEGADTMAIGAYFGGPAAGNGMTGVRSWLNNQGYNDNQIGYDNGNVSLNGKYFMSATPASQDDQSKGFVQGSTYASPTALQGALNQYNQAGRNTALNTTLNNMNNTVNSQPFQFKQQQQPFTYDPNSDQAYQAALNSAKMNIQTGQNNTMANLLAHGQGNSSYAATATQQVANREMNNVANNILPQLISQAYNRWQDQNNNDYRNQLANYNSGQDQIKNQSALAGTLNGMNQQDIANAHTEAGLTGYYMPPGANSAISDILNLKQQAEQQGVTPEQMAQFKASADQDRAQLAKMGINPNMVGFDSDYATAANNVANFRGIPTLQGTEQQANLTGTYNGNKTYAAQQQDIKNAIERVNALGFVNKDDAALLGVPEGTTSRALQVAMANNNIKLQGLQLKQQANDIAQQRADNQTSLDKSRSNYYDARSSELGPNADKVAKQIDSTPGMFKNETTTDQYGQTRNTGRKIPADPNQLEQAIISSGLPENEMMKLYQRYFTPDQLKSMGFSGK